MEYEWNITKPYNRGLHGFAALSFKELIRLREEEDRKAFNELMQTILPDVEEYIARSLSAAVRNGDIPSGKYKVEEFVNELYLIAFDHIGTIEDEKELPFWLFKKADELLEERIIENERDTHFIENIERFTAAEWQQMQEEYSVDGEGELVLLEEFDDPSYPKYEYTLADAFIENPESKWIEKLHADLSKNEVHDHIDMVLHRLPAPMKSIYDLAVNQKFAPIEIAKIKGISVEGVHGYLAKTREIIRMSFESRYVMKK